MTKFELANEILDETKGRHLRPDESPDDIIYDAALCGLCLEAVIPEKGLESIVAQATDIDNWHDLLVSALSIHTCPCA